MTTCLESILNNSGGNDDRINDLPDAIIHHIFSFLDNNYMARISMVSKKWRQICLSSPYLYFAESVQDLRTGDCKKFINSVDGFMSRRDNTAIHSFYLDMLPEDLPVLDAWISELAKYNVQDVHLNLHLRLPACRMGYIKGRIFSFPESLFRCKSLRVLELHLVNNHLLELPLMNLPLLEVLTIVAGNLVIKSGVFQEWISTCCPSLKKLSLSSKYKFKIFENHNVEHLAIKMIRGNITPRCTILGDKLKTLSIDLYNVRGCSFKISAPNLQVFNWGGKFATTSGIGLGDFTSLRKASISIERNRMGSLSEFSRIVDILYRASSAEVLCLYISLIEIFLIRDQEPMLFENVRQLDLIVDNWEDYHIPVIGTFIQRLPNLVILNIERKHIYRTSWGPMADELLKSRVSNIYLDKEITQNISLSPQLKEVNIQLSCFDEEATDVKLVKLFVEVLYGLEKLTVFYPSSFSTGLSSFVENVKKASPGLAIVFVVKELEDEEKEVYYFTDSDDEWTDEDYEVWRERYKVEKEEEEEEEEEQQQQQHE